MLNVGICEMDSDGNILRLEKAYDFGFNKYFKDWDAYERRPKHPCYVPEDSDSVYTAEDVLAICNGQKFFADDLFGRLIGQIPEIVFCQLLSSDEWRKCPKCGTLVEYNHGQGEVRCLEDNTNLKNEKELVNGKGKEYFAKTRVKKAECTVESIGSKQVDHETLAVIVDPGNGQGTMVVTTCPHCKSQIKMSWDTRERGFKAFCPVCGKLLMLCRECECSGEYCDFKPTYGRCRILPVGLVSECYIVVRSDYAEGISVYAFENAEDAEAEVTAEVQIKISNLRKEGYKPIVEGQPDNVMNVYVTDSNIYYEWEIHQSGLVRSFIKSNTEE